MKSINFGVFVACLTLATTSGAFAWDHHDRGWHHDDWHHHDHHHVEHHVIACAPEAAAGGIQATKRILTDVAKMDEFKDASFFQSQVTKIASPTSTLSNQEVIGSFESYLKINSDKEFNQFLGEKEMNRQYVDSLQDTLQLSNAQAEILANRLHDGLLNNLGNAGDDLN